MRSGRQDTTVTAVVASGLFVAAAGLGALIRWLAGRLLPVPLGTLAVNTIGAFLLGLISGLGTLAATVIGVAGLGALTTFSTLAAELREMAASSSARAAAYLAVMLVTGITAAAAGMWLAGWNSL